MIAINWTASALMAAAIYGIIIPGVIVYLEHDNVLGAQLVFMGAVFLGVGIVYWAVDRY